MPKYDLMILSCSYCPGICRTQKKNISGIHFKLYVRVFKRFNLLQDEQRSNMQLIYLVTQQKINFLGHIYTTELHNILVRKNVAILWTEFDVSSLCAINVGEQSHRTITRLSEK